ncbi:MAG: glycerol-3-phosphate acyltransferase [Piscirickettsiaceae bacterium]|nr:MAG: glycerol-3-phosphate acyltransferase [Piscirickettsiaceae bacterium]PCI66455.1 MAG: glycerol-3-phosphate acyltransferase [Piscirickettsiaceae bacterium]
MLYCISAMPDYVIKIKTNLDSVMEAVVLPYWVFVVLIIFASIMVLDRLIMPSMRWYLNRRVNRVITKINSRLDIKIRPFQFTRRQALIDQLVFDNKVIDAIKEYAEDNDMPQAIAQSKARIYASEIVPAFNAYIYFKVGYWLAKTVARMIYRVRVGFYDNDKISAINADSSVVFVMNHRSNMDYILVSFLVAEKTTLSYAVGEWARIWPLQMLIKSMGAFFVRRNSGNPLYRKVLERYVNLSTRAGVCQAVFLEGGLTKDGVLRDPHLGFLDYMLRDYHPHTDKDIVFVPVGINYDRVLEDRSLIRQPDGSANNKSFGYVLKTTLIFLFKTTMLSRKNRWRRFGYASVNFGEPISAKHYCQTNTVDFSALEAEERFTHVGSLARFIMGHISDIVPVVPSALMSTILLEHADSWKSELQLKMFCLEKINQLKMAGAPIDISNSAMENVLSGALTAMIGRGLLEEKNNLYKVKASERDLFNYYANSISQWN